MELLLLSPRERSEFAKYQEDAVHFLEGADACVCDSRQSHGSRSRVSCVLPTLMSSSKFFSFVS